MNCIAYTQTVHRANVEPKKKQKREISPGHDLSFGGQLSVVSGPLPDARLMGFSN
jgi:hypothetical protein